jgi:hypothetical protein
MKFKLRNGFLPTSLIASAATLLMAAGAHAAFSWNETGAMLYDGTVDANPYTQSSDPNGDVDIKSGGSLTVQNGTLNINPSTSWGDKVGNGSAGTVTVNAGGVLNWTVDNDNEDRLMLGNGTNGNCTLNLNGGGVFNVVGPGGYNHVEQNVRFGSDTTAVANVNLSSGTFDVQIAIPVAFGGKWTNTGTTWNNNTGVSTMTVTNGWFKISAAFSDGKAKFDVGNNDAINFITGGTGGLSLYGWTQTDFEAFVTAGKIKKDGVAATASDFIYTLNGNQGEYVLNNASLIAPSIVTQPASVLGVVGGNATFTATASGNPSPSLLWEVSTDGGSSWSSTGNTSSSLSLTNLTYSMDGRIYHMVATNSQGTATTNDVFLSVDFPAPTITAQPASIGNATVGSSANFSVTATGLGTLSYQWQKSTDAGNTWADVSGATGTSLTLDPVAHTDAALYRCVITDSAAEAESLPATTATSNWVYLALTNDSSGFVWSPVNSTMTYDGTGADSGINPYSQFGNDIAIGFGNGSSSLLTVSSGTLSIINVDQWSLKIGQNHVNGHTGTGVVTVNTGATLNLCDTGSGGAIASNEQRVVLGARANGTLNVSGGTVNVHVGPGSDASRSFMIGGSGDAGYTGTLNLNSGTLNYPSDAPVRIGYDAGAGLINVGNGQMRVTGTSTVLLGNNDYINFTTGGTGSIAILNWDSVTNPDYTQFKALVDGGKIQINGLTAAAGDYTPFIFSDDSGLGVMKIDPSYVASPYVAWATTNAGGQSADLDFDNDGVSNGIEFFLGATAGFTANPGPVSGVVTWTNGGNIADSAYGTEFKVQTSPDLATWTDILSGDPNLSNLPGSVSYTLPTGAGKLFVRLLVSPN